MRRIYEDNWRRQDRAIGLALNALGNASLASDSRIGGIVFSAARGGSERKECRRSVRCLTDSVGELLKGMKIILGDENSKWVFLAMNAS